MTEKPLADVWATRDFPVLVEVTRRIDAGERIVAVQDVAEAIDMPVEQVERAAMALATRGFLTTMGTAQRRARHMKDISGEAYLLTGLHPDGDHATSRLISALEQAVERTPDEEKRRGLRHLLDSLKDAPREIVGAVIATSISTGLGMG